MAISRSKKEEILKELKNGLKDASAIVFTNFHGVNVSEETNMRKSLREKGSSYKVAKKTLIKQVLEELKIEGEKPDLKGEVALAYGSDAITPVKDIYEFTKTYKDRLEILGGVFENTYIDTNKVISLAKIPSQEVLYRQLVYTMNAPVSCFASVLNNTIGSLVQVLGGVVKVKK